VIAERSDPARRELERREEPLEFGVGSLSVRVESPKTVAILSDEQLSQLALDLAARLKPPDEAPPPDLAMFGELAHLWLARVGPKRVEPKNEQRDVERLRPLFLEDERTLTAGMVEALLERQVVAKTGKPIGAGKRNKLIATGRRIIEFAQREQMWGAINPFKLVKRSKEETPAYELLTLDELAAVQRQLPAKYLPIFRLCLHLGLRPGECLGLTKGDVDFARGVIHVRHSHERGATKTGKARIVPIVAAIAGDVRTLVDQARGELLFTRADGSRFRRDTKLADVLHTAMAEADVGVTRIEYKCRRCGRLEVGGFPAVPDHRCDCGMKFWAVKVVRAVDFYGLRHMSATFHHAHGADPLCVSLALGHSVQGTTHRVYTHPDDATMRRELSRWSLPA
jgi:integrase